MTLAVVIGQFVVIFILLFRADRERQAHEDILTHVMAGAAEERRALADRIQHPETRQVEPAEQIIHESPTDPGELAWLGQEVPDHIKVGSYAGPPPPGEGD